MLKNIVALVTGGASGLGRATAERLVKNGASVAILDLPTSDGKKVADELGKNALFSPGNVTSERDVGNCLDAMMTKFSVINTVVHCAGIGLSRQLIDYQRNEPHPLKEFEHVLEVNAGGMLNVVRLAAIKMMDCDADGDGHRGVVINTSSISAYEGQIGQVAYAASHGAITSMTLPVARDLAPIGIRCITIAPGIFDTPYTQKCSKVLIDVMTSGTFPKRQGRPDEFAHLVEHIICNKMINGCVIRLDACLRLHT